VRKHDIILSDNTSIPFGLGVWSTGVGPTPFVKNLPFDKDRAGRILVDEYLKPMHPHADNIYVAGDCAAFVKDALPPTAQAAEQGKR
jgi:NADH:ubiquinone reductase (non-electrogenic)